MTYCRAIGVLVVCVVVLGFYGGHQSSWAGDADPFWVSKIVSVQGRVLVRRQGDVDWRPGRLDDIMFVGDQIRVAANSRAGIVLSNDAVIRLDQHTTIVFGEIDQPSGFILNLLKGAANFFSTWPRRLNVVTPFVNGVVEGTEFFVRVDDAHTRIDLFEGRLRAVNEWGELQLAKGQGAVASAKTAPQRRILVDPRDSVQWSLYYPPVLAAGPGVGESAFGRAKALYDQGEAAAALEAMDKVAQSDRDSPFYAYRAALLLNVGRVDQAQKDIQQALSSNDANSEALALQAVIAVVQNRKTDAMQSAKRAVELDPRSAAAQLSLSYAHQADFNLQAATAAAQVAVTHAPDSGTAWARLAELRLSTGELDKGVRAAQRATALDPNVAHAQTILGFAYLTQIKIEKAQAAFTQAIALDSAAPLPRLGLGLAKIRDGDLEQGRAQIEIAAGLDPGNALIRSYLGKAYFDEKRGPLDERQFEIAKNLDPNDPTPWFYDAIRKQTLNRPVEALQDLQYSIQLNQNRSVYRSKLFIDQDLATRGASLGRIYNDLRFHESAIRNGYASLTIDPSNYSAHRLLSDSLAFRPRHKIARVSELLQSQMLQPLNITPIQPQLAEPNLFILEGAGPGSPSLNEYNTLFSRNRAAIKLSGVAGDNQTIGDEVVAFGLRNKLSLNAGQFYYETDGFRENNDQIRNLYDIIGQYSLSYKTTMSSEFRYSEHQRGDLPLRFDPDNFAINLRTDETIKSLRIGFRHQFAPFSHLIGTIIGSDFSVEQSDSTEVPFSFSQNSSGEEKGVLGEIQHIFLSERLRTISGVGYFTSDTKRRVDVSFRPKPVVDEDSDMRHFNAYLYGLINLNDTITCTLGASGDFFDRDEINRDQINPKIGVAWDVLPTTKIRASAFRVLKRSLFLDQTLEPTQVAGFNQFFDDNFATDVWKYGIALDQELGSNLYGGVSVSKRNLEFPFINARSGFSIDKADWREQNFNLFLNWTPLKWLSINMEHIYEKFERDDNFVGVEQFTEIITNRSPVSLGFYHPCGAVMRLKATYFDQNGKFGDPFLDTEEDASDHFWVLDTSIEYRLPKRLGTLSISVLNLLDEDFKFQDTDPSNPSVWPERTAIAKVTIQF